MVKASSRRKKPCTDKKDDTHIPVHRKRTPGQEDRLHIKVSRTKKKFIRAKET
ncbi:hypothetical protein ACS0TY_020862 [Phlomoides rotata]